MRWSVQHLCLRLAGILLAWSLLGPLAPRPWTVITIGLLVFLAWLMFVDCYDAFRAPADDTPPQNPPPPPRYS